MFGFCEMSLYILIKQVIQSFVLEAGHGFLRLHVTVMEDEG